MTKKSKDEVRPADDKTSFEHHLGELEQLVQKLETGQLGLSESLQFFEAGLGHLRECQRRLAEAEERIALVLSVDAEGNAETRPLDLTANSGTPSAESRGRKR